MFQDQCISITDLRTQTKKCLEGLDKHEKYVFVNNKPKAVIVNLKTYEFMKSKMDPPVQLIEMDPKDITPELRKLVAETKKMKRSDFTNI